MKLSELFDRMATMNGEVAKSHFAPDVIDRERTKLVEWLKSQGVEVEEE